MSFDAPNRFRGSGISVDDLCAASFWRSFAPSLHISEEGLAFEAGVSDFETLARRMRRDGYFGGRHARLDDLAPRLAEAVGLCVNVGLPPVFIWAFNEPWASFHALRPVISGFLGQDYKLLPAFWAWHVDPRQGERGWRPHRDNSRSLDPDGTPQSLTCWIPLTEATPLNSCMYILPAYLDPYYGQPTTANSVLPDLSVARALPAKPGEFLIWNQAVLHWGSPSSEFAEHPRISMALEFQRADIPRPSLMDASTLPSFETRMRLIAMQILQYTHMYGFSTELRSIAEHLRMAPIRN
ncbi:MAG: phytanoyl-CoA dioxygenase family protein [Hyphomonadaceae bacterium]